ncbi:MAG: ornithine cyclodeaminase family protein, partial [Thermoplasmata archaeon]
MEDAVAAVEGALAERRTGTMVSPPRTSVEIGPSGLTITPGGFLRGRRLGMRVYLPGGRGGDQLTAVWGLDDRQLRGIVLGSDLGAIRTGAIGGVAAGLMSHPDAERVAILGAG